MRSRSSSQFYGKGDPKIGSQTAPVLVPRKWPRDQKLVHWSVRRTQFWGRLFYKIVILTVISKTICVFFHDTFLKLQNTVMATVEVPLKTDGEIPFISGSRNGPYKDIRFGAKLRNDHDDFSPAFAGLGSANLPNKVAPKETWNVRKPSSNWKLHETCETPQRKPCRNPCKNIKIHTKWRTLRKPRRKKKKNSQGVDPRTSPKRAWYRSMNKPQCLCFTWLFRVTFSRDLADEYVVQITPVVVIGGFWVGGCSEQLSLRSWYSCALAASLHKAFVSLSVLCLLWLPVEVGNLRYQYFVVCLLFRHYTQLSLQSLCLFWVWNSLCVNCYLGGQWRLPSCRGLHAARDGTTWGRKKKKQPGSGSKNLTKENIVQISKASYKPLFHLTLESFFRGAFSVLFYRFTLPKSSSVRWNEKNLLMPLFAMQEQPFFVLLYLVCLNLLLSFELRGSTWQLLTCFVCSGCLQAMLLDLAGSHVLLVPVVG